MDLKQALKEAIKGEIEGRELYKSVSEKTNDEEAKKVFEYLANEENSHKDALITVSKNLVDADEFEVPQMKDFFKPDNPESPIFSVQFKDRIKDKHFEMSALSIGMKLEKDSFEFYESMVKMTDNKDLKVFFQSLADWEKHHYDMLSDQIKFLETKYFDDNNFAPF